MIQIMPEWFTRANKDRRMFWAIIDEQVTMELLEEKLGPSPSCWAFLESPEVKRFKEFSWDAVNLQAEERGCLTAWSLMILLSSLLGMGNWRSSNEPLRLMVPAPLWDNGTWVGFFPLRVLLSLLRVVPTHRKHCYCREEPPRSKSHPSNRCAWQLITTRFSRGPRLQLSYSRPQ